MRFKLARLQLWFEILKYLDSMPYFECMMTELKLINKQINVQKCFTVPCRM